MSLIRQFAIRNELLYSGFVLPNVQIVFVQKISFATFGVSIDDFFTRYAGLGYSLFSFNCKTKPGDFTASYKFRSFKHFLNRGDFKPSNGRVQTDKRQIS